MIIRTKFVVTRSGVGMSKLEVSTTETSGIYEVAEIEPGGERVAIDRSGLRRAMTTVDEIAEERASQ